MVETIKKSKIVHGAIENWKSTSIGFLGAVSALVLSLIGLLDSEQLAKVLAAIVALLGLLQKD